MSDYRSSSETTVPQQLPVPGRALTIGAHPDDAEFGAGGTVAKWAAGGCRVTMLILTDGSKGTWDPSLDQGELIALRRREQRRAAHALGAAEVIHLDHVDGELTYTMELRAELAHWIRRLRPDVVLGHDPWRRYMLHPDHRAAGWATVDGVVAARDHLFFPEQLVEGLTHHRPEWLLLWAADEPDHFEDISGSIDAKIEALLAHSSQGTTTMEGADADELARTKFVTGIRRRAAETGHSAGYPLAESFKIIEV